MINKSIYFELILQFILLIVFFGSLFILLVFLIDGVILNKCVLSWLEHVHLTIYHLHFRFFHLNLFLRWFINSWWWLQWRISLLWYHLHFLFRDCLLGCLLLSLVILERSFRGIFQLNFRRVFVFPQIFFLESFLLIVIHNWVNPLTQIKSSNWFCLFYFLDLVGWFLKILGEYFYLNERHIFEFMILEPLNESLSISHYFFCSLQRLSFIQCSHYTIDNY